MAKIKWESKGGDDNTNSQPGNEQVKPEQSADSNNRNKDDHKQNPGQKQEPNNLGEAPELPPIFFAYDPYKKKLEVRDRRGNVITGFDVMTAEGADAYHLWKEGQKQGSDTSFEAFMKAFKGEDGKTPKSPYEEWRDNQPENTNRSLEAYLAQFKGADGKSAFEQWKEVHGEYVNPSINDFFEYLHGKDGDNGDSAFEIWAKLHAKPGQVLTEADFFKWIASQVETQSGDTFVPHYENGQLYFVSNNGDKTVPYKIKGEDGNTYYPHIDGYELYFTTDKEGNGAEVIPRVNLRGKQGRTFTPVFDGTELHFEDGEGEKTKSVDLRGKNAYELWVENGHPDGTYEDYIKFFSGHVVTKKYSYKDIKDFTAPVQHINRHILTDSDTIDAGLNAEEYYLYRQEQIEAIREEGRAKRGNMFQEIFWWCSGADTSVLRTCPADHSKYVGIGTVIFFTALMAFFSSFIAMHLVFNDLKGQEFKLGWVFSAILCIFAFLLFMHYGFKRTETTEPADEKTGKKKKVTTITEGNKSVWAISGVILILGIILAFLNVLPINQSSGIAIVFALFWSAMIFFLDRFITNTMYSDGKTTISWLEFRSALPRILISIFLGIVISAPLELKIFNREIKEDIRNKREAYVNTKFKNDTIDLNKKLLVIDDKILSIERDSSKVKTWQSELKGVLKDIKTKETQAETEARNNNKLVSAKQDREGKVLNSGDVKEAASNRTEAIQKAKDAAAQPEKARKSVLTDNIQNALAAFEQIDTFKTRKDTIISELAKLRENYLTESSSDSLTSYAANAGLYENLIALHSVAMKEGKEGGYKEWNLDPLINIVIGILCGVFLILLFVYKWLYSRAKLRSEIDVLKEKENASKDESIKESIRASISSLSTKIKDSKFSFWCIYLPISIVLGIAVGCYIESLHYLFYYLTTPIGLIMLLFILIDVSPVFYKMMLADGRYDKILNQDKMIEQDLIRVRVAKTLQKVNESELSSLSPFIFGNTYDKIKKLLAEKVNKDRKAVDLYDPNDEESQAIHEKNRELFEKVLGMKYRIAYASYAAWYRNMYDLKLGYTDTEEGTEDNPETIKNKCVLSFRSVPEIGGNIKVCPDDGIYTRDSTIHITAEANEGFKFAGWRDDATAAADREILVVEDKIYVAYFEKEVKQQGETA